VQTRVGKSSLYVPLLGLGTAPLGNLWSDVPESQAIETIHFALDNGVTFLDTAPYYDSTLIERRVGLALAGVPRDSYVLATKVGRPSGSELMDFSRDGVLKSIEESLKRLKVDRVDILHLHDPDQETYKSALEEAYPVLDDMRRQGMIKAVGVGANYWELLVDFARDAEFDCFLLAGRYTLLEQGALGALNLFRQKGISIFGAGVYNTGILAKGAKAGVWYQYRAAPPEILDRVCRIETICERYGVPLNAAAVHFVKAHPAITSLVIGAESAAQLAESVDALQTAIPLEFWADLRAAGLVDVDAPIP
jgi:D-threo-aldose 1-dehydrogenase